jgi:hypothetical protein
MADFAAEKEDSGSTASINSDHMSNLALIFGSQVKWNQAEKQLRKVINSRKSVLGAEHLDTLTSVNNLCIMYEG